MQPQILAKINDWLIFENLFYYCMYSKIFRSSLGTITKQLTKQGKSFTMELDPYKIALISKKNLNRFMICNLHILAHNGAKRNMS